MYDFDREIIMERMFYVYALLDPRKPGSFKYGNWKFEYEPFYIGKGKDGRVEAHFQPSQLKANTHKANKIRKILKKTGDLPLYVIKKQHLTELEAFDLERKLIYIIGRGKDGPLTNGTDGGDGTAGKYVTRASRKQTSQSLREYWETEGRLLVEERVSNWKKTFADKSETELADIQLKKKQTWQSKSNSSKREFSKFRSEAQKSYYNSLTPKEQEAFQRKCSEGKQRYWDNISPEAYEQQVQSRKEAHARRSKRRKSEVNSKISESVKRRHAATSSKEKARKSAQISTTLKNIDPAKRKRLNAGNVLRGRLKACGLLHSQEREYAMEMLNRFKFDGSDENYLKFVRKIDRVYPLN